MSKTTTTKKKPAASASSATRKPGQSPSAIRRREAKRRAEREARLKAQQGNGEQPAQPSEPERHESDLAIMRRNATSYCKARNISPLDINFYELYAWMEDQARGIQQQTGRRAAAGGR